MKMDEKMARRGFALILALVMISACVMLAACGKSSGSGSEESEPEPEPDTLTTEGAYVSGKCFVLCAMRTVDDEYSPALIKDMFDIKSVGRYMQIYFREDGTAFVHAKRYGKKTVEGKWGENKEGVTILEMPDETFEFTRLDTGELSMVQTEDDGDEFYLTFHVPEEDPDTLIEYMQ